MEWYWILIIILAIVCLGMMFSGAGEDKRVTTSKSSSNQKNPEEMNVVELSRAGHIQNLEFLGYHHPSTSPSLFCDVIILGIGTFLT